MQLTLPRASSRWALAALVCLSFSACRESAKPAAAQPARSVQLADGSRVEVRTQALRLLPSSASVVDFLVALAGPERFAGLPEQALEYASLRAQLAPDESLPEAWRRVPQFRVFQAEDVIALRPDLVLAEPWQDKNTLAHLVSAGIECVVLPEVRDWPSARATLLSVGELLQEEPRAAQLLRELDARVEALAARPGTRRGLRVLCYSNFGASGWSAGENTTIHAQIGLAGLRNAMAETGREGHVQIAFEELIALDPDILLVSKPLRQDAGSQGDRGGASAELLRSEPSLRGLRAVKLDRIVALPPQLFATASQELITGAETLADAIDALLKAEQPVEKHE
jgi:ABC-type Fe3+-hydroxamate transport system substrate-binding protein